MNTPHHNFDTRFEIFALEMHVHQFYEYYLNTCMFCQMRINAQSLFSHHKYQISHELK